MLDKQEFKRELKLQAEKAKLQLSENLHLRLGVGLVLFILISQPLWWLTDYRAALTSELTAALENEAKITRTASENVWTARAEQSKELERQLNTKIALAKSPGIAQATMQNWLSDLASNEKLSRTRIDVDAPTEMADTPGIYRVAAKVDALFDEQKTINVLAQIEQHPSYLVVERAELGQARQTRMSLLIVSYFKITNSNSAAAQ
ncbi:MAG: hypothetical protein Q7T48_15685 [Cellvibrio sp.]|uniref:hypothetical protein n=1 Tax=Cellvibrio sp. TaxID=1965322 RepID=UPI00271B82E9|nr:hypothetical protein [Cellvibrio sp.]